MTAIIRSPTLYHIMVGIEKHPNKEVSWTTHLSHRHHQPAPRLKYYRVAHTEFLSHILIHLQPGDHVQPDSGPPRVRVVSNVYWKGE